MICLRVASERHHRLAHASSSSLKLKFKSFLTPSLTHFKLNRNFSNLLLKKNNLLLQTSSLPYYKYRSNRRQFSSTGLTDEYLDKFSDNRRYLKGFAIQAEVIDYFETTEDSQLILFKIIHFFKSFGFKDTTIQFDVYLPRISKFLVESEKSIINVDVVNLCYGLGGWNKLDDCEYKMTIVNVLARHLVELSRSSNCQFDSSQLSMMIYGLRGKSSTDEGVRLLLPLIKAQLGIFRNRFDINSIAVCLYGLKSMDNTDALVKSLLNSFAPLINSAKGELTSKTLPMVLGYINEVKANNAVHKKIINFLSKFIDSSITENRRLDGISLTITLQGLIKMSNRKSDIHNRLSELIPMIEQSQVALTAHNLSLILKALHTLRSDDPNVPGVISAIIPFITACVEPFDQRCIAFSLYGLKEMDSNHPVVRKLLSALIPLFASCPDTHFLDEKMLSMALNGLQNMSNQQYEVVKVLQILIPMIDNCNLKLNAFALSSALYGMRSLNCESKEALKLVTVMTPLITTCDETFSAELATRAMNCLRRLDSRHVEVQLFIQAITPKILLSPSDQYIGSMISNSAASLRQMQSHHTAQIWQFLTKTLESLHGRIIQGKTEDRLIKDNIIYCIASLSNAMENTPEIRNFMVVMTKVIPSNMDPFESEQIVDVVSGFARMRFERLETSSLLRVLLKPIKECTNPEFTPIMIAKIMFGLRSIKKITDEVRELLDILADHFSTNNTSFNSKYLANTVYGFVGLNASEVSVRKLIQSLIPSFKTVVEPLTSSGVGKVMLGLQNLTSGYKETKNLIIALDSHIASCKVLDIEQLCDVMLGLRCASTESEYVRRFLVHIVRLVGTCKGKVIHSDVPYVIAGFKRLSTDFPIVRELLVAVLPLIPSYKFTSKTEMIKMREHTKYLNSSLPEVKELHKLLNMV